MRPSESSTVRRSSVTTSVVTRMCCVSTVEEGIPGFHQSLLKFRCDLLDPPKLFCRETTAAFKANRIKPDLRFAVIAFDMDVRRFNPVARI